MKFPVKKNPLLVLLAISLIPLGIMGVFIEDNGEGIVGLVVMVIIAVPVIWALFKSYHIITEDSLIMVFGPIKKSIPLWEIRTVEYSYNPLSSPAWTFKRLNVVTSNYKSFLMSSPQNEKEFKELLQSKCPRAKVNI